MIKNDLQKHIDIVKNSIEENFDTITSIVYKYDVEEVLQLKGLSGAKQDKIIESCINDCLSKIQKKSFSDRCLNKIAHDVDEIIDFYSKEDQAEIIEEASDVAFDLIRKATGHNGRKLPMPIALDFIKNFCIHNIIKNKDIQLTTMFILLHLSAFVYCLDHNTYDEKDL